MKTESISKVLARYLRGGWACLSSYDMLSFGFDPFRDGPVTEEAFRLRAADLLERSARHHLVED